MLTVVVVVAVGAVYVLCECVIVRAWRVGCNCGLWVHMLTHILRNRDMEYRGGGGSSRGTFHWTLDFTWEYKTRPAGEKETDPLMLVAIALYRRCCTRKVAVGIAPLPHLHLHPPACLLIP